MRGFLICTRLGRRPQVGSLTLAARFSAGVPCGRFADAKRLRAGPRGFCLSRTRLRRTLKQKHRSGLSPPDAGQAVGPLRA